MKQGSLSSAREIASIWCELVLVDLRLKLFPYRMNRKFIFGHDGDASGAPNDASAADLAEVARLADRVARAARFHLVFTMSCLRRSLVLRSRLTRAGIASRLVFGACKTPARSIVGHAWLAIGEHQIDTYGNHGEKGIFHRMTSSQAACPGTATLHAVSGDITARDAEAQDHGIEG